MGPGQNTRTMKTVQYKPPAASAKCWGHFHLRKVILEVKGPDQGLLLGECPEGVPKTRGAAPPHIPLEVLAYHAYWVRVMHAWGPYHGPKIPGGFVG